MRRFLIVVVAAAVLMSLGAPLVGQAGIQGSGSPVAGIEGTGAPR